MKQSTCALIAATAAAQSFLEYPIMFDGTTKSMRLSTKEWSTSEVSGNMVRIAGNNSLFMRNSESLDDSSIWKPRRLRGGSIEYDVDVSAQESGCVAGVYVVNTDNSSCGEVDQNGTPQCKSIDAMQANRFGFESKAHPCANGTCDAMSQCIIGMQKQGVRDYGEYAYGPNGSFIDTNAKFHVKNEFVSTTDYQTFWKLRTILSQNGSEIVMEADCRDYLTPLNDPMDDYNMGFVLSSWDNTSVGEDFELDWGQSKQENCDAASNIISNFSVKVNGSTECMPDDPDGCAWLTWNVYLGDHQGDRTMYVKSLEGQSFTTSDSAIIMRENNRVWVMDSETTGDGSKNYWAYQPNLLGGTMQFDVDLSEVDCACASGIYLVNTDEETCNWDAKARGETPQCSRIEIMEANKLGYTTAAYPCEFGVCPSSSETQQKADEDQYGAGAEFVIDSTKPYRVITKFFAPQKDGEFGDLAKIETTLKQEDRQVVLRQDNQDYLQELTNMLRSNMAVVISNSDAGESNNISNGQCTSRCGEYKSKIMNTQFIQNNSVYEEPEPKVIIGGVAEQVRDCGDPFCTSCHMAWYENDSANTFLTCTDHTRFKYTNLCKPWQSKEKCGYFDICFQSYPFGDKKKWKSDEFACRPIQDRHLDGYYQYSRRTCKSTKGLCAGRCGDDTCHNSWPVDDPAKWRSDAAMCRCKK